MNKLEKYGYSISKLKIIKCRKEFEFSIEFKIEKSDDCYRQFQNASSRYTKSFQVFKQEDLDRYTNKNFIATEEEFEEYLRSLDLEPKDSVFRLIGGGGDSESIARVLLANRDLSKLHQLSQVNHDKFLGYEDDVFQYHEFIENNPIVFEALRSIKKLRRYTYKPTKRTCTSDLFCILKTLDTFWS